MSNVRSYKPHLLDYFGMLKKFGHEFLSEQEAQETIARAEKEYLAFLGESLVKRRGKAFWSFHEENQQRIGYRPNRFKLYLSALLWAVSVVLRPVRSYRQLRQRSRRRRQLG
jgi:hypothetical protein